MRGVLPIVALLALLGASDDVSPPNRAQATLGPVAVIGDSLGVGLARPLRDELAARGLHCSGHARGGTHAGQWLSREWLGAVLAMRPKTVIISLGTNDAAVPGGKPAQTFAANVAELAKRIRAAGARPVFLQPPPMPWPTDRVREALLATGELVIEPPPNLARQPDRVHPTAAAYVAWAARIRQVIP